ncbi:MAG: glycosyltransferase [Lachnospiraceae bacterium]|nr:glycosyltransferase [Lachnospiraceae bacterium]
MTGNDLTVVIPNYNKSGFIVQCVESIEEQTLKPAVILIIDDASTDDSKSVIEGLSKRYSNIETVFLPENSGVSAVRNRGLSLVKTEFVTFIDADDLYYDKRKLENETALINEHGEDTIAYSVTAVLHGDDTKTVTKLKKPSYYLKGNIRFSLLTMSKWDSVMRDYIIKAELLRNAGGYAEGHSLFEDYELLLKLSARYRFFCTGCFGTGYREGNGISKERENEHDRIINEMIKAELENETLFYRIRAGLVKSFYTAKRKTKDFIRKRLLNRGQ